MRHILTRALAALVLLCALSTSALAVDVTIAGSSFPAYNYPGATAKLRIYPSQTFTASDSVTVPGGTTPGSKTGFFFTVSCTVASNTLTCPSVTLKSTTDALDLRDTVYHVKLFDANDTPRDFFPLSDFALPHTVGSTTTWAVLRDYAIANTRPPVPGTLDADQTLAAIAANNTVGNPAKAAASPTPLGRVAVSVTPADPALPIALGDNDPRVPTQGENDALAGTSGSPSALNKFVTDADPRLGGNFIDVTRPPYSAAGDAQVYESCAMSSGLTTVTCTGAAFGGTLNGQKAVIAGAGSGGATLVVTISGASGTTFTASVAASTPVSGKRVVTGSDNTSAFAAAVAAVAASSTVKTVYVPAGNYLFTTSGGLNIPAGVRLQGTWATASRHLGYRYANEPKPMAGDGSTLVVAANEGTATGAFIAVSGSAHVSGFHFFYPAQVTSLTAPKVYPWTVELTGSNPALSHCELTASYQGIYMHVGQGHLVYDIFGQPLKTGLYASQLLDTSWVERVNFFPSYAWLVDEVTPGARTPTALAHYVVGNSAVSAFKLGRVDNLQMSRVGGYGFHTILRTVTDSAEVTTYAAGTGAPGGRPWAHINGFIADGCVRCVDILDTGAPTNSGAGLTIENGNILAFPYPILTPTPTNVYGVITDAVFSGYLRVANMTIDADPTGVGMSLIGSGSVVVVGNTFGHRLLYDVDAYGLSDGTTPLYLTLDSNHFMRTSGQSVITHYALTGSGKGNVFKVDAEHALTRLDGNARFKLELDSTSNTPAAVPVALTNGWVNFGGGYAGAAYYVSGRQACLRGVIKNGTAAGGTQVNSTLIPVGLRPANNEDRSFVVQSNSGAGVIQVTSGGAVLIQAGSNTSLSLDACWEY